MCCVSKVMEAPLYLVILTEYVAMELKVYVCMCVRLCVSVWTRCNLNGAVGFDETFNK